MIRPASRPIRFLVRGTARWRERLAVCAVLAAALATALAAAGWAGAPSAAFAAKYDPGASDTEIKVGNIMPYSGPASAYAVIGYAIQAYFKKVNAEGGINGRKVNLISLDDGYSPPKTVEQARRLVEQEQVLLLFASLGTATNSAIQKYMNSKRVPQLFVVTGASKFGKPREYPWTMGFITPNDAEAKVYAKYVLRAAPDARIGVLYQYDDFGKDYLTGFKQGLGARAGQIVMEQTYEVTAPTVDSQIVNLKNSGATVFLNISTPKFAALAIRKAAEIGWKPLHIVGRISASVGTVMIPAGVENAKGIVSSNFMRDPDDPEWSASPEVTAWRLWMKKYNPQANPLETENVTGYTFSQALVQVLKQCGDELTRDNVMRQAANLKNLELPMLLPGIRVNTSPTDYYPVKQMQMLRFTGDRWERFGPIIGAELGS